MATSRRTGTNENVNTYGGAGQGRDYTLLNTWEIATDNNLVSLTQSEVLECYDDLEEFDDNVNVSGATTSADYHRIIRPAGTIGEGSWQGHNGTPSGGGVFFHTQAGSTSFFNTGEGFSGIQDLIIKMTNPNSSNTICIQIDVDTNLMVGIIMIDITSADNTARGARCDEECIVVNCIAIRVDNWGFNTDGGNSLFFNCNSISNGGSGFDVTAGEPNAVNCLSYNNGGVSFDASGWGANTDYNAADDGNAPGTNSRDNQTFTFVNEANDDYHLANNDAGAKGFADDLSATGPFQFDDDIDGDLRS